MRATYVQLIKAIDATIATMFAGVEERRRSRGAGAAAPERDGQKMTADDDRFGQTTDASAEDSVGLGSAARKLEQSVHQPRQQRHRQHRRR